VVSQEPNQPPVRPHEIQEEALTALANTRRVGNRAGLVVLATGLGKTWLAAFDSHRSEFRRILFVAHREEILAQALETFRRINPAARLGNYDRSEKDTHAEVLFASIQTIGKPNHLARFEPTAFDYIVIDEFHHGSAPSYRRLIDYFEPKFMLGLTATPERTDGGDLLALCQENLVYRCDLGKGIQREKLCPFHYFGVPDDVDYRNIPWRSTRFDEEALTTAVATLARANNALDQFRKRAGKQTLAFCVSQRHANFMAQHFRNAGVSSAAVHAGPDSDPRAASLDRLKNGELEIIFAVDMFNEGVDLPSLDTVMMLRPTESKIMWLQQFGRGLRTSANKPFLTVIDYIGNHRTFLLKPLTLLEALMPLKPTDRDIWNALESVRENAANLPPGCEVTYDLESIEILKGLLKLQSKPEQAMREYYLDFKERNGQRPTAVEAFHDGFSPRFARPPYGSWLRFVQEMGDLTLGQQSVLRNCGDFLEAIETTAMTRSYKMLVLRALLRMNRIPGDISVSDLAIEVVKLASTSSRLKSELTAEDHKAVETLLRKNPIAAWTGAKGTKGKPYFELVGDSFGTTFSVVDAERESFRQLVRELVDWRLAEYVGPDAESKETMRDENNQAGPQLWELYQRDQIPPLFGLTFSEAVWNKGYVRVANHIFFLVTLKNANRGDNFTYINRFLAPDRFECQSQNQTTQSSKPGQEIRNHAQLGIDVHLFARREKKTPGGTGASFYYCGDLEFLSWEGEKPITLQWKLANPLPERLQNSFRI